MNRLWTWVVALAVFVVLGGAGAAIFALEIPTGSLDGQVLSPKKLPLSQVKVTAMGPVRRTVLTDIQGRYHFDRLRIGEYQMNTALYGYERQWQSEPVKIMEGKTTKGINFALVPTRPALNFSQYQRVFLPAEPLRIAYRGTLVDSVHLELSRTSLDGVLKLGSGEPKAHLGAHPDETLIASWDQKSPSTEDSSDFWFYRHIGLDKQPEGVYRLRMMGKATVDGQPFQTKVEETWFTISHVGIVAKRTPDTVLLYAVDLVTKQPLPGVQVAGGPTRTMRTAMGTTDKDGLLKVSGNTAPRTFVGTHGGAAAFLKLAAIARRDPEEGYAYTDRPIYRPEQTVHLKAVLRERTLSGFQVPAGRSVQLTISDASGEDVYKRQLTTNAMGAVDDDFTLGRQPSLGEYAAKFKLGDVTIDQTFEVKAYRKPEFRVDVAPAKRQLIAGEPLQATVSATYYFGAPVTGQKVRYTVYRTQTYPWMTDEDWFYSKYAGDGDSEYDWGYGEVVTSGTTQTDDAGHISLTVPTSLAETRQAYEPTHEYRYTVEVETTDQTNRAVTTRAAVIVAPSQVRAATDPARYVVGPGEAVDVTVKTRNLANEPVAASGTAAFFEVVPAPLNADGEAKRVDTYKAVSQSPVATDAHGVGRVSFQAPAAGSYLIVTTLSDAAKRQTVASTNVWVSAEGGDSTSYRSEAMQIVFDKKRYKAGDTATVFIARPTAGVPILLTIEGDRLHETLVLRGGGPSVTVKLPVKAEYSPNAYISAIIVDGKQLVSATRSLNVMPADKFLTVTVTPDQKRYKPGDTARLTVSTVDAAGHGVPAEVSVGVVDEAIYALSPDHTPDPRSVFHGPRANTVDTAYSFAEDYSGGADKDAANPRVRKNFLDTAAWFPAIRTDGTGKAVVSVPLPDNLTTWIVTTRAHTADTKVGGDRMSFLTSQDLIVRLATPRFMVEGDRLTLIGLIHSYLPKQTTIRATLSAMGLALGGSGDARVTIDPNGVAKQTYALTAETAGTATLTLKASGDQAGDALEQAFPILPHGTADIAVMAGTSTGKTDLAILIPKDAVPGTATLAIELTPTPLGAVAGALTYLRDYPYGCIEQTLNRFVPELVAGPLVDARIDTKRLRDGMERISALQHQDGGWGWWVNDGSTPTLTAYTLLALKEAHAAGLTVPEPILRNGTQYLIRQWPNLGFDKITPTLVERGAGPDEQALVLHALSRWGLPRQDGIRQLNTNREGLSPQGLAHLAMAAWYAGDRLTAGSLIGSLDGLAINSEALSHWEPTRTQPWFSDTTETTGLVVRAMTLVQPDSPRIDAGVRYLLTQRRGSHWQSTKDTAATVLALAAVSQRAGEPPATMPVTVTMDGKTLAQTDLADPTAWRTGYRINVKADQLTVGNHSLTIQRDDSDTRALPYSLERSVFVRADHLDAAAREGLTITRKYRMLTAAVRDAKAGSNYARWFSVKEAAVLPAVSGKLAPGDLVLVELSIDTAKAHGYAMIEDPLPSGMEVIPDQNGDIAWSYWWSHREVRDDKVAFFIRQLPAGKHQVYYVLRPEIPGTVRALPPVISEMYAPDVRARDAETQLTVGE